MAYADPVKARFDQIHNTIVAFDEEKLLKNKRIAKLIVLNFCKYLRQGKHCEVECKGQGKYASRLPLFRNRSVRDANKSLEHSHSNFYSRYRHSWLTSFLISHLRTERDVDRVYWIE